MALIHCNFYSKYLAYDTQINVILPEARDTKVFDETKNHKFQVLYLLHGRGDDCNGWIRNTSIERYANEHCIAVVMPSGEDSFYVDGVSGKLYGKYITEELPEIVTRWFPISDKPEDTFIAGLSMGGYGAAHIGFSNPEKFAGIGLFSAGIFPEELYGIFDDIFSNANLEQNLNRVFGTGKIKEKYNIRKILERKVNENAKFPTIVQFVGKQDIIYDMNDEFRKYAEFIKLKMYYEEWDGVHDWKFWDAAIVKALNIFNLKNKPIYY